MLETRQFGKVMVGRKRLRGAARANAHPARASVAGEISNREIPELESLLTDRKQRVGTRSNREKFGGAVLAPAIAAFAAAIVLATLLMAATVSQAQQTERAKQLGSKMMCVCGCNQVLTACNHVGCTYSHSMLKELDDRIARGDSDDVILQSFIQEYGTTVLIDPPKTGFTGLVWVVPIVAPILAFFLIWELVKRWRHRAALVLAGGPALSPELLDRARREADRESDE